MKKNANILDYVEKYKYKYGISYANEGGKLVKSLYRVIKCFLIYIIVCLPIVEASLLFNAQKVAKTTQDFSFFSIHKSPYTAEFYIMFICFVLLIALLVVAKKRKMLAAAALLILPVIVWCFAVCTENQNGFGYKATFYFIAIPAAVALLLVIALVIVLIRAKIKTDSIYNMIVEGLYKQYGVSDGEKLTEDEWIEFLSQYNPYKRT